MWTDEDEEVVADFVNEIKIMAPLKHPNLIFFYGGVWTAGVGRMCIVLEFAGRGGLDKAIGTSDLRWSRWGWPVACDIAKALVYIHSCNLIHRDIKPANVLLTASFTAKMAVSDVENY